MRESWSKTIKGMGWMAVVCLGLTGGSAAASDEERWMSDLFMPCVVEGWECPERPSSSHDPSALTASARQEAARQEVTIASTMRPAPGGMELLKYEVNAGDTLYKISRAFHVPVEELQAANPGVVPSQLQIGQQLDIPHQSGSWDGKSGSKSGQSGSVIRRVLNSTLTAYTAGFESTGKTPSHPAYGITRSGSRAEEGRTIAVDPTIIPLGSTVLIEGIGIRTAEDTGSAIKGSRIDVFIEDLDEALEFGVKKDVKVYVLSDPSI